jgi:hypothetical protein
LEAPPAALEGVEGLVLATGTVGSAVGKAGDVALGVDVVDGFAAGDELAGVLAVADGVTGAPGPLVVDEGPVPPWDGVLLGVGTDTGVLVDGSGVSAAASSPVPLSAEQATHSARANQQLLWCIMSGNVAAPAALS